MIYSRIPLWEPRYCRYHFVDADELFVFSDGNKSFVAIQMDRCPFCGYTLPPKTEVIGDVMSTHS